MAKLVVPLLAALIAFAPVAGTYAADGVARSVAVTVVASGPLPAYDDASRGFVQALRRAGLALDLRTVQLGTQPEGAERADVVLALGTPAATELARSSVPARVVFAVVVDPEGAELMSADKHPRARATGVSSAVSPDAQLELLRAIVPDARRIAVVYNESRSKALAAALERSATRAGLTYLPIDARAPAEVAARLSGVRDGLDAIIAVADPSLWNAVSVKATVMFSLEHKKPLFGFSTGFTRAGAIASVSAEDYQDMGAQAADQALAMLSGRAVGEIPIAEPRHRTVSLNLIVARRIGLEPPRAIVDQAAEVFR